MTTKRKTSKAQKSPSQHPDESTQTQRQQSDPKPPLRKNPDSLIAVAENVQALADSVLPDRHERRRIVQRLNEQRAMGALGLEWPDVARRVEAWRVRLVADRRADAAAELGSLRGRADEAFSRLMLRRDLWASTDHQERKAPRGSLRREGARRKADELLRHYGAGIREFREQGVRLADFLRDLHFALENERKDQKDTTKPKAPKKGHRKARGLAGLTPRQYQGVELFAKYKTYAAVAREMRVCYQTAREHVLAGLKKLEGAGVKPNDLKAQRPGTNALPEDRRGQFNVDRDRKR